MDQSRRRVIVVGGGLAGLAAATALAAHADVTLLESRFALGGRAGSFEDQERPGELLDNCQHVLLGCCTNLLDLYTRLGATDKVAFHKRVHFLDGRGTCHDLWSLGSAVPAPLHLGPAMALFSALSLGERVAVMRAMMAMLRLGKSGREKLEGAPFGQWLHEHRQPPSLVKKFYDPIVVSGLNEETRRASAKYAIQIFQDALLANSRGYVVGLPACPLGELYARVPPGVNLRLNTRVEEILFEKTEAGSQKSEFCAVGVKLRDGEELRGDAVILATNHHAVQRWLASGADAPVGRSAPTAAAVARDGRFSSLEKLESVPILGVHMWFDRSIMAIPAAALIEGPLQWLFRKDAEGRALHGVISAARAWPAIPKEDALQQFEAQIRTLFPAARDAKLLRGVIVIEKRAHLFPPPRHRCPAPCPSPARRRHRRPLPRRRLHPHRLAGDDGGGRAERVSGG